MVSNNKEENLKLTSTPPRRYRPRTDYEGSFLSSVGRVGHERYVTIRLQGDRQWVLEMTIEEYQDFRNGVDRMLERY